ncbi:hypothetical protein [Candidatus Spongiihabitans sp.]|uniref:hypothetical protein n=1 Tax=Candidatus Spongiihabitans sp. TaxID=3101308 RepID=UPI003C6FB09C
MKEIHAWVPWFQELAQKIADGGKAYLIEKAKEVAWVNLNPALLNDGDENIDPFSFVYCLAQKNTKNQRRVVFPSAHEAFRISSELPDMDDEQQWIFPTPSANTAALFHDRKHFEPEKLWRAFRKAVQPSPQFDENELQEVLAINQVGVAKLTQSLFLINPYCFLTVDNVSLDLLQKLQEQPKDQIKKSIKREGWSFYQTVIQNYKNEFPSLECYEINLKMYQDQYAKNEYWLVGAHWNDIDMSEQFIEK